MSQLVRRVLSIHEVAGLIAAFSAVVGMTSWPSGLRRYVKVAALVGMGAKSTVVIHFTHTTPRNINHHGRVV